MRALDARTIHADKQSCLNRFESDSRCTMYCLPQAVGHKPQHTVQNLVFAVGDAVHSGVALQMVQPTTNACAVCVNSTTAWRMAMPWQQLLPNQTSTSKADT